ncbi:hypothetical protein OU798_22850 [Prolixibacteraceae bacterium Z1-6]|uniref:Glycoside hydrolase family 31 protein n=1 Tax=Draconibacterium aestuarii TaxID=2998507 RepID=A0A9X3FDJ3_9BACT|nr:hypothetical protein [Prolixibacteraceae bacterium Z1-6]
MMKRIRKSSKRRNRILAIFLFIMLIAYLGVLYPLWGVFFNKQRHGNPPLTPAWALECWLWEDDYNTAEYVDTLLAGYAKHDIPVRTIMIDSPWSTRYNDFNVDSLLYPDPQKWFGSLKEKGYRVVLWMTSMVDSYDKDTRFKDSLDFFNHAEESGYLAANGRQIKWWKGKGGFIDYSNPETIKWWRGLQQNLFDYGIDGWKLDGTATLFFNRKWKVPFFYQSSHTGMMTTRKYMDHYYRDEYLHGLTQNSEFITLSRSVDRGYHPEGFAPVDAAPVTWVGDQRHSWKSEGDGSDTVDIAMDGIEGIEMAMDNVLKSAKLGYNIIGSDVAGFSGRVIPPRLYIRWAQFSAFCGLFLNGGHGDRMLWNRSEQEFEIIRRFSWLHTELIPYIYTYVVKAHNGGNVLQRPVKGKYHYLFGENFLVAPIYKDELKNEVTLPEGEWRYFFDDKEVVKGPVKFNKEFTLEEYPVYLREGAIVPMDIKRNYTGIGDQNSEGYLTLLIYPNGTSEFTVHHPDKSGSTTINVQEDEQSIQIHLNSIRKPHILTVNMNEAPSKVEMDGTVLRSPDKYFFNPEKHKLFIKTENYTAGKYTIVR